MTWLVVFDHAAVLDLEDVTGKAERKAVFNAVHKLTQLGPRLPPPHMKSLKGETDLFELRPRQGSSAARPIYTRIDDTFTILAVAKDKASFDSAVDRARSRMSQG